MRIVSSLEELASLPRDPTVNGLATRAQLRLLIPDIACHAQMRSELALNRLQARCGCMAGALATLASLGAGTALLVDEGLRWSWRLPLQVALVLAVAFALGLAGKLLVLVATRWQFARACRVHHRLLAGVRSGTPPG